MIADMTPSRAELSSLATALEEMTRRVTGLADDYARLERDEVAGELYAVERSLAAAARRLARVVDLG